MLQQATLEKEVVESPTMEIRMEASTKADPDEVFEREPVTRSHKLWRMGETNLGLPTMDQVMMDATQAAAKMTWQVRNDSAIQHVDRPPSNALTNQGEVMMFHIHTGTPQDEDQDRCCGRRGQHAIGTLGNGQVCQHLQARWHR